MKKILLLNLIAFLIIVLTNCKGDTASGDTNQTDSTQISQEENTAKNTMLTPDDIDINKPVPVMELKKAFFAWAGKEVTVIGYCDVMFSYGSVKDEISLVANPDSSNALVRCSLKQDYEGEKIEQTTPVVVKGTVDGGLFGAVELKDCEIVSIGGEIKSIPDLSPENIPSGPVSVQDLKNAYFAWINKEVSVIGYYHSTTTSTTSYGTTIRVDLADPDTHEKAVGCRMLEEPTVDLANNRDNVVIRGIIKEEVFGNVLMEECEIVK